MTNFEFLKNLDKNLYEIASDAEKLYRDEYFEQCIAQTRRFGENICRNVLKDRASSQDTFDIMISTLKDKTTGNPAEKEFIDDMYFLKKTGNASVHGSRVKKDGIVALECLQRSFEAAINYTIILKGPDLKITSLRYDEELLILGKKNKKTTLQEKYTAKKLAETKKSPKVQCKAANTPKKTVSKNKKNFFSENIMTLITLAVIGYILISVLLQKSGH